MITLDRPSSRPTYDYLRGALDEAGFERACEELDRRYAWARPPQKPRWLRRLFPQL
jgi:hypothetical protein